MEISQRKQTKKKPIIYKRIDCRRNTTPTSPPPEKNINHSGRIHSLLVGKF
jgi:hypothetical protein